MDDERTTLADEEIETVGAEATAWASPQADADMDDRDADADDQDADADDQDADADDADQDADADDPGL